MNKKTIFASVGLLCLAACTQTPANLGATSSLSLDSQERAQAQRLFECNDVEAATHLGFLQRRIPVGESVAITHPNDLVVWGDHPQALLVEHRPGRMTLTSALNVDGKALAAFVASPALRGPAGQTPLILWSTSRNNRRLTIQPTSLSAQSSRWSALSCSYHVPS